MMTQISSSLTKAENEHLYGDPDVHYSVLSELAAGDGVKNSWMILYYSINLLTCNY